MSQSLGELTCVKRCLIYLHSIQSVILRSVESLSTIRPFSGERTTERSEGAFVRLQQLKNSCGAAFEAITSRSSKPPHNSGLN